jgi:hypothetical protein
MTIIPIVNIFFSKVNFGFSWTKVPKQPQFSIFRKINPIFMIVNTVIKVIVVKYMICNFIVLWIKQKAIPNSIKIKNVKPKINQFK